MGVTLFTLGKLFEASRPSRYLRITVEISSKSETSTVSICDYFPREEEQRNNLEKVRTFEKRKQI